MAFSRVVFFTENLRVEKPLRIFKSIRFSTTSKLKSDFQFHENLKNLHPLKLIKPFLFTVAFSSASLIGAAIWHYENTRPRPLNWQSTDRCYKSRHKYFWNNLDDAALIFIPICIANMLVFMAWRIPQLEYTMMKYFYSNPAAKNNCWPMLFSAFSHSSFLHIFANMYALQSFCEVGTTNMGKEEFLGFYLAACVISTFASYLHKVIAFKPGVSLGASGAIMGLIGYTCVTYPDTELSIILFPFLVFKAGMALKFLMGVDLAGIILGWKYFDHAAHLGGAAFGVFWGLWGHRHIWQNRDVIVKKYQQIRKKF